MPLTMDEDQINWNGRVESKFADENDMAVMIAHDGVGNVVNVWDFDFNSIKFTLPEAYASDDAIDMCLRLYVSGYKAGVRMGKYKKAAEIKRTLEIA